MDRCFVVVSGLPGSGKSTFAQRLATALRLALLDKDAILERLFESKATSDVESRRTLSRESDLILQTEASASDGAVLVSHWHLPGMPLGSGTPTDWLPKLSARVVNVHCDCSAEIAAARFVQRKRHPGHHGDKKAPSEILASIRGVAELGRLDIGPRVDVNTSQTPNLDVVLHDIHQALEALRAIRASE